METVLYNHRNGQMVVSEGMITSVCDIIHNMHPVLTKNSVSEINRELKQRLDIAGWVLDIKLDPSSKISITGVSNGVGLCIQTGNISRIYADLLKLQALYINEKISAGIIIAPVSQSARILGSNMANFDRISKELPIFAQVITTPIVVIGFDGTDVK